MQAAHYEEDQKVILSLIMFLASIYQKNCTAEHCFSSCLHIKMQHLCACALLEEQKSSCLLQSKALGRYFFTGTHCLLLSSVKPFVSKPFLFWVVKTSE